MSSTRNFMITILLMAAVSLHAITLSTKVSMTQSQFALSTSSILYPPYSEKASVKFVYDRATYSSRAPHLTPMDYVSGSIQGSGMINNLLGLYGEFGSIYTLHGSQMFASGSLKVAPNDFSPFIGLGVYYTAQNAASVELGLSFGYLPFDLSTETSGTLFHNYTEFSASGVVAYPTNVNLTLTYPFNDRIHSYVALSYGLHFIGSTLPVTDPLSEDQRSALLEEPSSPQAAYIGDYYGKYVDVKQNGISVGLKLDIKEIISS